MKAGQKLPFPDEPRYVVRLTRDGDLQVTGVCASKEQAEAIARALHAWGGVAVVTPAPESGAA